MTQTQFLNNYNAFEMLANKPETVEKAKDIFSDLLKQYYKKPSTSKAQYLYYAADTALKSGQKKLIEKAQQAREEIISRPVSEGFMNFLQDVGEPVEPSSLMDYRYAP